MCDPLAPARPRFAPLSHAPGYRCCHVARCVCRARRRGYGCTAPTAARTSSCRQTSFPRAAPACSAPAPPAATAWLPTASRASAASAASTRRSRARPPPSLRGTETRIGAVCAARAFNTYLCGGARRVGAKSGAAWGPRQEQPRPSALVGGFNLAWRAALHCTAGRECQTCVKMRSHFGEAIECENCSKMCAFKQVKWTCAPHACDELPRAVCAVRSCLRVACGAAREGVGA